MNKTTKMNGYRTPEMIADSIHKNGQYIGCCQMDQFLNHYYIFDAGNYKAGVEVTFLNGKAVATRRVPVEQLTQLINRDIQFGGF